MHVSAGKKFQRRHGGTYTADEGFLADEDISFVSFFFGRQVISARCCIWFVYLKGRRDGRDDVFNWSDFHTVLSSRARVLRVTVELGVVVLVRITWIFRDVTYMLPP